MAVLSRSEPGTSHEVTLTDDKGIVCTCFGYASKVLVGYRTGLRNGPQSVCYHARIIAHTFAAKPRQPDLYWVNLVDGKTFLITERTRSHEEHMLAFQHQGELEPLEKVNDTSLPRSPAVPISNTSTRLKALKTQQPQNLVIATAGASPHSNFSRTDLAELAHRHGAVFNAGTVTSHTSMLVVGHNPGEKKLARARALHIPTVDYPLAFRIIAGHFRDPTTLTSP